MNASNIQLTERAAEHVKSYLGKLGEHSNLRVAVKPTGCSGYQYVVEAADGINPNDVTFESNGVNIVVDDQSLPYLAGSKVDYVKEGLNEGFQFNNPNVQTTCGCGESFTIENEASQ